MVVVSLVALGCTSGDDTGSSDASTPSSEQPVRSATTVPVTDPGPDLDDFGSLPPEAAGEATGPLGSTELRVDTDAGTVQIGSGSVPERLGSEFPLPTDFVVQLVSETGADLGFSGTTDWTFEDLIELYTVGLPAAGYTIGTIDRRGTDFAVFEFTDGAGSGNVAISEAPGPAGHTVIVTFGDGSGAQAEN
jgi:hypothetical protein